MTLTIYDEFAGWGGSSQGTTAVPGTELVFAANHDKLALEVHGDNFPGADHFEGDVAKADIAKFPRADLFWASPACPAWTDARGKRRDFDRSTQGVLWDEETGPVRPGDAEAARSRALMEEIPRYLRAMRLRGKPVLAGAVENVIQCRKWDEWRRWLREIEAEEYQTRVIALNSMHARPIRTSRAPQSRNRLYVAYWHRKLGRRPGWDRWLRPKAYCPTCDRTVDALQVFKRPGVDMGSYGRYGQYWYRCPSSTCRNRIVEPDVLPAVTAIDWSLDPGQRIGERVDAKGRPDPLEPPTIARIEAGLRKYVLPLLAPAGGTWRDVATPLTEPMPARTTRDTDGVVFTPPLLVPVEGRDGIRARTVLETLRTQTCRNETGLVVAPFIAELRGGGSKGKARGVDEPLATFAAQGQHHGLVQYPDSALPMEALLVSYFSNGKARPLDVPLGAVTTKDRHGLVGVDIGVEVDVPRVEDCTFRMLAPHEIAAGMAFAPGYKVKGTNRQKVRGYGNAVTPPAAEVIFSALVEAITGEAVAA